MALPGELEASWEYSTVPLAGWGKGLDPAAASQAASQAATKDTNYAGTKEEAVAERAGAGNEEAEGALKWRRPVAGEATQRSLAGWLARFPVFEPHWQVRFAPQVRTSGSHLRFAPQVHTSGSHPRFTPQVTPQVHTSGSHLRFTP